MPAQVAGDMNSAGAAVPAEQEASAGRKKAASRTVKGRRKRGAETALAANDEISQVLAAAGQDASAPVPEYLAAAVNSVTLAAANDEMASEPIASVQKGERLDTAALQVAAPQASEPEAAGPNVSVHEAIAQESAVQTPVVQEAVAQFPVAQGAVPREPAATLPDIAAGMPLSTLDFQRMREQQRAEKQAGATTGAQGQGTGVQAADAALTGQAGAGIAQPGIAQAPMTQAGIAQAGMPEAGSALAGAAQMGIAGAAAVPNADAAAIQAPVVPDFSALLEQQRQGIPIDLSALQMPGQGAGAVVMKQPQAAGAAVSSVVPQAALNAGQAPSVVGSQTNNAQAAAEHAARQPRSRLWQMVESARRMLGMGRSRRGLWIEGESTGATTGAQNTQGAVAGASAQGAVAGMAGFGEASPLSLASTLNPSAGDWPSIVLPSDLLGTDGLQGLRSATQAPVGPGWFETTRRRPGQMRLLRHLMGCHFSPSLARTLVELLPADFGDMQADEWLRQMLMRALASVNRGAGQVVDGDRTLFDEGGVFALIGPTGVGKTTSIAKIAAHHVLRHGPRSLALITADVYRIGAQEQLRAFGRMLGVPVQVAQDRDTLQHLLKEHEQSRLVLIDTAGIGQRDERVTQLTSALEVSQVRRVLVMNAAAQPGSIEEVLGAFGARETSGVLLSKVDEAVGLGACLDALIRHRLPLLGYADGQRVPEDYHAVNFSHLIGLALDRKTVARFPALKMTDSELRNLFEDAHV